MKLTTLLLIATLSIAPLLAVDKTAGNVYRVQFTIHESTRNQQIVDKHYTVLLEPDSWGRISTGVKVPYQSEKGKVGYVEIGVNVNCKLRERPDQVSLEGRFEVSSLAGQSNPPRIEQVRSDMSAPIPIGKETRIVSLDDASGTRHYDIDVVVTKL